MLNISHQPFETLFRSRQTDGILLLYKGISQCLSGLGSHSVEAGLARTSKVSWTYVHSDEIIIMQSAHVISI